MAKRLSEVRQGFGRLLDAWTPPPGAGEPVGCAATSFTFDAVFFEEECLGRFLGLSSDPDDDGPAYILEREEKLAQLAGAIAIVDGAHCAGSRSLRWDLLPARVPGHFLHAKVSLLCWARCLRLVVASANLTPDGYRRNQEVFGVLDWMPEAAPASSASLREAVSFFRFLAPFTRRGGGAPAPALGRQLALLERVEASITSWGIPDIDPRYAETRPAFLFMGPGRPSLFQQLGRVWPGSSPPDEARVFSPFFDSGDGPNRPAQAVWQVLRQRGAAAVRYLVPGEDIPGESDVFLQAPASLIEGVPAGRREVAASVWRLRTEADRPFHAKGFLLQNAEAFAYCIGSSNFTTAGLGLDPGRANIEANLVYLSGRRARAESRRKVLAAFPAPVRGAPAPARCRLRGGAGREAAAALGPLPAGFGDAVFECAADGGRLLLAIGPDAPAGWRIADEDQQILLAADDRLVPAAGGVCCLEWTAPRPPSGLWVAWPEAPTRAWWPVQVRAMADLPPPDVLRDLSLDVLIQILTASRPLHVVLQEYLRRRAVGGGAGDPVRFLDPLRRVDSSRFLLQRTRRVGLALTALRERLERPAFTEESLAWRLHGPVGVAAVRDSILREACGEGERVFLLCELSLELSRCQPAAVAGALPLARVQAAIREVLDGILRELKSRPNPSIDHLPAYVRAVLQAVRP